MADRRTLIAGGNMNDETHVARLYVWLENEPGAAPADATIDDVPGVNDIDQIAEAIRDGRLGPYLPVTLHFADHPTPTAKRIRSLDIAKLLRDRHIRHRRRYEVIGEQRSATGDQE
jgi:hypothetical protein